jgi:DNA-binding XRE family transcriptional regulator
VGGRKSVEHCSSDTDNPGTERGVRVMTNFRKVFSSNLKRLRENRGLTQADLAKRTGLNPAAISHFETGQRLPSLGNYKKLLEALRIPLDTLMDNWQQSTK